MQSLKILRPSSYLLDNVVPCLNRDHMFGRISHSRVFIQPCAGHHRLLHQKKNDARILPLFQHHSSFNKLNSISGFNSFPIRHQLDTFYSTKPKPQDQNKTNTNVDKTVENDDIVTPQTEKITIFKRFKNAYKEYGKVLVVVHCLTSAVWYGSFVYAARSGVDVVPWLEWLGASEAILKPFKSSGVGDFAVAYLMYKVATPARYTVTIGGTQATVKWLRHYGYMAPVPQGDSFKELMKDGRTQMKDKMEDRKEEWRDKREKMKEKLDDKKEEWQERKKEMKQEWQDRKDNFEKLRKKSSDTLKDKTESNDTAEILKDKAKDLNETLKKEQ